MKKKLLLFIGSLIAIGSISRAQTPVVIPDYVPLTNENQVSYGRELNAPDPQVWSFMTYRGDSPNLYTGTVNASIPIYTYEDEDFKLPISLSYASNGYMPNMQANDVGLGWFLNTGGMITREVRGVPDDYQPKEINIWGYMAILHHNLSDIPDNVPLTSSNILQDDKSVYYYSVNGIPVETEPDIFTFNFLGHSGNFMLVNKEVHVFNTGKEAPGEFSISLFDIDDSSKTIVITTGDGYHYKFIAYSESQFVSENPPSSNNPNGVWTEIGQVSSLHSVTEEIRMPNNWHLYEIVAPNGRKIVFDYGDDLDEDNGADNEDNKTHFIESRRPVGQKKISRQPGSTYYVITERDAFVHFKEEAVQLRAIRIDDKFCIRFIYGNRPSERYVASVRDYNNERDIISGSTMATPPKLDSILICSISSAADTTCLRRCALSYTYRDMNVSSSFSIDESLAENPVLMLTNVNISGIGDYSMEYYRQTDRFPLHGTYSVDHWGYFNNYREYVYYSKAPYGNLRSTPTVAPDSIYYGNFAEMVLSADCSRKPNADAAMQGMLKRMTYPTGGYTTYEYEAHTYSDYLARDRSSENMPYLKRLPVDSVAGGVRIRKITDYTAFGTSTSRTYLYVDESGRSTGNLLQVPIYKYRVSVSCNEGYSLNYDLDCVNNTLAMNYVTGGPHIEYESVKEVFDDGANTVYKFADYHNFPDVYQDDQNKLLHPEFTLDDYDYYRYDWYLPHIGTMIPLTRNFLRVPDFEPAFRGALLTKTKYNQAEKPIRKEEFIYWTEQERPYVESVILAGDSFYKRRSYLDSYDLIGLKTYDYSTLSGVDPIITEYQYGYNRLGQMISVRFVGSDGYTRLAKQVSYVSDIPEEERTVVHRQMLEANVLNPIITLRDYTQYISDPNISANPSPGLLLNAERYEYKNVGKNGMVIIRPAVHYIAKIGTPPISQTDLETLDYYPDKIYNRYSSQGRLLEMTNRYGLTTSYVWGYGGLYVVAEITGVTYSAFESAIGLDPLPGALFGDPDEYLRSLPNAMVTTYEYLPYVGITRERNPFGISRRFRYNEDGKLMGEYDRMMNPIKTYSYSTDNQ